MNPSDHRAWVEYWADQGVKALREALVGRHPGVEDYALENAVRYLRCAHSRAMKAYPRLKEPK